MDKFHIVVCIKVVPKPEEIAVDKETMLLIRDGVRSEINPPDMNAIEMALKLKDKYGGKISILSMGPPFFADYLRVPLAMGADHIYLMSDRNFGGADTLATTYTLAEGIRKIGDVDMVICGEESSDGATGQVPAGLAEWLGINQLTQMDEVDIDLRGKVARGKREIAGGHISLEVPFPVVVSAKTASNEPRFMDYTIKPWAFEEGRITVWGAEDVEVEDDHIGLPGSPTIVSGLEQAPERARKRQFLEGSPEEIADQLGKILVQAL